MVCPCATIANPLISADANPIAATATSTIARHTNAVMRFLVLKRPSPRLFVHIFLYPCTNLANAVIVANLVIPAATALNLNPNPCVMDIIPVLRELHPLLLAWNATKLNAFAPFTAMNVTSRTDVLHAILMVIALTAIHRTNNP